MKTENSFKPIIKARGSHAKEKRWDSKTELMGKERVKKDREERENLVLWKAPVRTITNFVAELFSILLNFFQKLQTNYLKCLCVLSICALFSYLYKAEGPDGLLHHYEKPFLWGLWWVWLGVLSSVGLGTGLHTFLLFLGPFIAKVTLEAYNCGSVDFVESEYPDNLVCQEGATPGHVSILDIMAKVRFPAFCWGAGTALGELPPYFMARTARLTGEKDEDDEDLEELEEIMNRKGSKGENLDIMTRGKIFMHDLVQKVGFFGILAAASIPNPLFDLAGITCGHFLVPFWTFFGATLIGKAIVKMHIQKMFIIFVFSEQYVLAFLSFIKVVPGFGPSLYSFLEEMIKKQKAKLQTGQSSEEGGNPIGKIFEYFVFVMVAYFVVTIVNSLAQSRLARAQKAKRDCNKND